MIIYYFLLIFTLLNNIINCETSLNSTTTDSVDNGNDDYQNNDGNGDGYLNSGKNEDNGENENESNNFDVAGMNPFEDFDYVEEVINEYIYECNGIKIKYYGEDADYYHHCKLFNEKKCKNALNTFLASQSSMDIYFNELRILCSRDYYNNPCPFAEYIKNYNEKLNQYFMATSNDDVQRLKEEVDSLSSQYDYYLNLTCTSTKSCLDEAILFVDGIKKYEYLNSTECFSHLNITTISTNEKSNQSSDAPPLFLPSPLYIIKLPILLLILLIFNLIV